MEIRAEEISQILKEGRGVAGLGLDGGRLADVQPA